MKPYQTFLIGGGALVLFPAFFFGLMAFLTRDQRRLKREIRQGASKQGWRYRRRHWEGRSIDFHLEGRTPSGRSWIINSGSFNLQNRNRVYHPVETVTFHVPELGGEVDLAVLPRGDGMDSTQAQDLPGGMLAGVGAFSANAASALEFFRDARESPSGLGPFDAAFRVLVKRAGPGKPLIDQALAECFLQWPAEVAAPHSVLVWRDPSGLHLQARLPSQPAWRHVAHLQALGEDLCAVLPAPIVPSRPTKSLDRLAAWVIRS